MLRQFFSGCNTEETHRKTLGFQYLELLELSKTILAPMYTTEFPLDTLQDHIGALSVPFGYPGHLPT